MLHNDASSDSLSFFWALWHIPYDLGNGTPLDDILFNRIVLNFLWAVLFAWVYNRTNGSVLAPALFHPSMNTFGGLLPRTDAATVLFVILVLAVIYRERMWKRLEPTSSAARDTEDQQAFRPIEEGRN